MNTRSVLIAISLVGASACNDKVTGTPPTAPPPSVLRVHVPATLVQPLEQVSVSIDGGSAADAVWRSSDESVATIARGVLTGISPGDATITASVGGVTGSAVVHVGWRPETRLFMGGPRFVLDLDSHVTLYPALLESSGRVSLDGRAVEWTTEDPSIARVDTSGGLTTLTTFAAGTTSLVGRFRGLVDSALVEVGGLVPGFGYFYSGDAVITDADYYDAGKLWTPAAGKGFSTGGLVSATWEPPYSSEPDLAWVGPTLPLRDAFMHVVSLDNVPCTAYAQADSGFHFVAAGSPLVDCYDSSSPFYQSVRMDFVAFRPGEFSGTLATIYPNAPPVTTSAGGIAQTSATADSRSYSMPGIAPDSVFWFVTAGAWNVAGCRIAPSDGSVLEAAVRVTCDPLPFGPAETGFEAAFYAVGFGANARRGTAPIGFAEVGNGAVTRKAVDGLDIATTSTSPQLTAVIVSGAGLSAFDRVPAVLVTAIGLNPGTCGISEPVQSTPTTVTLTVKCTAGISGFMLGVIY